MSLLFLSPNSINQPQGLKEQLVLKAVYLLEKRILGFLDSRNRNRSQQRLVGVVCSVQGCGCWGQGGSFFITNIFVKIQVYQDQLGGSRGLRIEIRDELVEKRP